MDWTIVIFTVVFAIVYGSTFFIKAYLTTDPKPPFDTYKFTATLVVAAIIGVIAAFSGAILNEAELLAQLGQYAGYTAIVETLLKAIIGKAWPTSFHES